MKPDSSEALKEWLSSQPDLSPASVAMAIQFIDARPDSIAKMVRAERIDDRSPKVFLPTFRFRWHRHSITFERDPGHDIAIGFTKLEAMIWRHWDDENDGEGYGWSSIDSGFLEYFDELAEREAFLAERGIS